MLMAVWRGLFPLPAVYSLWDRGVGRGVDKLPTGKALIKIIFLILFSPED
jgi:hypothetical protein